MKSVFSGFPLRRSGLFSPLVTKKLIVAIGLASITVATLGNCSRNHFVNYDDDIYAQNLNVLGGLQIESIIWAFTTTTSNHWHPLTWLSLQFDAELFGEKPGGYHCTNLLLHTLNTVLLFWLLQTITQRIYRSAIVAALFAIHPLHVESVAWVTERKDVLSTFFLLLTLIAYVRYTRKQDLRAYLLVVFFFVLGLLAKSMLITLPGVMLLFDYWPLRRTSSFTSHRDLEDATDTSRPLPTLFQLVREKLPLIAIAFASALMSLHARQQGGGLKSGIQLPLEERLKCAAIAATSYLGDTFWPTHLAIYYPLPDQGFPSSEATLAAVFLAAFTICSFFFVRTLPYVVVGWLSYLLTLLPVSGLVQLGSYAKADRYTYVPIIFIFVVLVWGVGDLLNRNRLTARLAVPLATAVIAACMVLSWQQVHYWHDSSSLWEHSLSATRDNYFARIKMGRALQVAGRNAEAHKHFQSAVDLRPDIAITHTFLGMSFLRLGQLNEAVDCLRLTLAINPHSTQAQSALRKALDLQRRRDGVQKSVN